MSKNREAEVYFAENMKPALASLLEVLKLNKVYLKAKGAYLTYQHDGAKKQVLDCIMGYGSGLLSHNHEVIRAEVTNLWGNNVPDNVQLSVPKSASNLAHWLSQEIYAVLRERYTVTFANSGAEAVEAAVKHASQVYFEKITQFWQTFELSSVRLLTEAGNLGLCIDTLKTNIQQLRAQNEQCIAQPFVLSAVNGYHGKTAAALRLTYNIKYRSPFGYHNNTFFNPDDGSLTTLLSANKFDLFLPRLSNDFMFTTIKQSFNKVSMVVVEPIQGEGGIRVLADDTLQKIALVCQKHQVSLAFDEIQSGSYRIGELLASGQSGVLADYYLLGKSLGGGSVKIAACLIRYAILNSNFGLLHTSTYADSGHTAAISLAAMQYAKKNAPQIKSVSLLFGEMLSYIAAEYKHTVIEVRGKGLLQAIEFRSFKESSSYGLQILDRSGYLHYVMASYLLNVWDIRVSAPLSASNTLRFQPPYCITVEEIEHIKTALLHLCEIIQKEDLYKLIEPILPIESQGLRTIPIDFRNKDIQRQPCPTVATKVGFITHFIDAKSICLADPSLEGVDSKHIESFLTKLMPVSVPFIIGSVVIEGKTGAKTHLTAIGIAITSAMARNAMLQGDYAIYTELCQKAINVLADEEDVKLVGLGQFSSILTRNATAHCRIDVGATTGNSYTTYLGIEAILERLSAKQRHPSKEVLGVVGAAGNIASIYAQSLARQVKKVILIGSSTSGIGKVEKVAQTIIHEAFVLLRSEGSQTTNRLVSWLEQTQTVKSLNGQEIPSPSNLYRQLSLECGQDMPIVIGHDLAALLDCTIVLAATSAHEPFLKPEHIAENTIVCDISVPLNCTAELMNNQKNIDIILGGIAELPNAETIPIRSFPLEKGQVYGCLGETIILGLSGRTETFSYGRITLKKLDEIAKLAQEQGLRLSSSKKDSVF